MSTRTVAVDAASNASPTIAAAAGSSWSNPAEAAVAAQIVASIKTRFKAMHAVAASGDHGGSSSSAAAATASRATLTVAVITPYR